MNQLMNRLLAPILLCLSCCIASFSVAQQYNENRYRHAIFTDVSVQTDVVYGQAPVWTIPYNNTDLKMDIYAPVGDPVIRRPLLIFAHAGGFLNGSKEVDDMVAICDSFARKGYVTASLAYRKGFNPLSESSAERAVYRGVQDGKAAVRYFKEHALSYGIDTNYIYFGGMSAGGFMALHVAYMDVESERPTSTYSSNFGLVNDLGCFDCAGNSYSHTSKVRAIMNYWGAIQDTILIQAGDTPILQMHGLSDPTVPFDYGHPFGVPTLPNVFGSKWIDTRVNNLGIYNEFYTSAVPSRHMLDGSDNGTWDPIPSDFWYDTLLPKTTDFLVTMTKSSPTKNNSDTSYICYGETAHLAINAGSESGYYRWLKHTEDGITEFTTHTNTLDHVFEPGSYDVSVVEFNEVYCSSDTLWTHIIQLPPYAITANFAYQISNDSIVQFTNLSSNGYTYNWDFGDQTTSTEFEPTHSYNASGTYTVSLWVTSEHDCVSMLSEQTIVVNIPDPNGDGDDDEEEENSEQPPPNILAINGLSWEQAIHVFPNPFNDKIFVENTSDNAISIKIYDLNGKQLTQEQSVGNNAIIDTQNWDKGLYLLSVISESEIKTFRLIKH